MKYCSTVITNMTSPLFQEYDEDWAKRIQAEKFRWHNSQWLEMVENRAQMDEDSDGIMYGDEPPYMEGDLLDRADLFYGHPGYDDPVTLMSREGAVTPEFVVNDEGEYAVYNGEEYAMSRYPEYPVQGYPMGYPGEAVAVDEWGHLIGDADPKEYGLAPGQIARPGSRHGRPVSPRYAEGYGGEEGVDMYDRPVSRMRGSQEAMHYGYR